MVAGRVRMGCGVLCLSACAAPTIEFDGELGRPIPLASGDMLPLPRLVFIDEGCPGEVGRGGCPAGGDRQCQPLLVDSLAPLSALKHRGSEAEPNFDLECLEIRQAAGLAADPPLPEDLDAAVARFRFRDAPIVRAPAAGADDWSWLAGNQDGQVDPQGVIGGGLLRNFAVAIRTPPDRPPALTFYGEFPGSERDLSDTGLAFAPLQFPGRLLGRDIADECDINGDRCTFGVASLEGNREVALQATRMVMDACVGFPPCGVQYETDPADPFAAGTCSETIGPDVAMTCARANSAEAGGHQASLVVATGVPGLVLFEDSAQRMFGDLTTLPLCSAVAMETAACRRADTPDGELFLSGWPPAGQDAPLHRLGVRAIALVPGLTSARGDGPCSRAQARLDALERQCERFVGAFITNGNIEDTTPPYRSDRPSSRPSLAVLGEARFDAGQLMPDPGRWIETLVLPETHPVALSLRRDVAPEAVQPDGLMGAALFRDTVTVFDYTDPNPGLRIKCLDPRSGDCLVAPDCAVDAQPACCFGLPLNLLVEYIVLGDDDTCCGALSAAELMEIKGQGFCRATSPP